MTDPNERSKPGHDLDSQATLSSKLLAWFDQDHRALPWRGIHDPYLIWISEIMLQQTRIETVTPYFARWVERFPTIADLAAASEQEVLQLWEGLGYYSRARNLHTAARQVVAEWGGQLPSEREELERLPGIGRYTAGAISSIAFGKDEAALDGNIRRVMARVFDVREPARSPEGERKLWRHVEENLPHGRAGDYNEALMDLGSIICTPRTPRCLICPLQEICAARALGVQEERPVAVEKPQIPHYIVTAAILQREQAGRSQVLISQRPANGLLGSLWEFPGGKLEQGETLQQGLQREIMEELGVPITVGEPFGTYQHAFTHFRVTLHAFLCRIESGEPQLLHHSDLRWVQAGELSAFPMGKIDRQIAKRLVNPSMSDG
jgi:A/G-specific adenine glycosylase